MPAAAQNAIAQAGEAENIIQLLCPLPGQYLWTRIQRSRSHRWIRSEAPMAGRNAGGPKIDELDSAVIGHQNVGGLEIPVHDTLRVCVLERLAAAIDDAQRLRIGATRAHPVSERLPCNELHANEPAIIVAVELEHARDALMGQAPHRVKLSLGSAQRRRLSALPDSP